LGSRRDYVNRRIYGKTFEEKIVVDLDIVKQELEKMKEQTIAQIG